MLCVAEMERRYLLMASIGIRNITSFNKKTGKTIDKGDPTIDMISDIVNEKPATIFKPLLFIVVVVDKLANMMIVSRMIESLITQLAKKALISGINLIVSTQRTSVM
ncbi:MAG: hypothetical protein HRT91_03260 [Piscirickettsiaceae bacterium]|nr:hypothetical protein [Piscirickettsiaceae bacterium]